MKKDEATTESAVVHSTFAVERTYDAPAARVFAAFAHEATKRRWFAEEIGSKVDEFSLDFRVGGREKSRFRFTGSVPGAPPAGTQMGNDTTYLDIVPDQRIVFAYTMTVAERRMSASLATVELFPAGGGTRLTFTEQAAFFEPSDGVQLRQEGWRTLLQRLDREVRQGG
jgi:uncharacterized protein YndB with AHSA1/START domain